MAAETNIKGLGKQVCHGVGHPRYHHGLETIVAGSPEAYHHDERLLSMLSGELRKKRPFHVTRKRWRDQCQEACKS